jgi:serine/threonine protein kinase/tetratricopeptide (TPR) repeat protein
MVAGRMATDPKNLVGTTLSGRYRIDKAIGEGGMGAIFQATQLSLGRPVAIKVVKSVHEDNSDAVRRFELETEVIARLAHPNIVQVVDAGKADDGTMYLAMELLQGESIRQLLKKAGTLPVARVLAVIEDVASALAAAHAGGVIHRDLKAENVMIVRASGKHEIAKVLDFGVAKLTTKTEAPPQTGSGFVAGTPGCIAPEQMLGKSDEPRSDLYSVGVLMFEMLAGEAPFVSSSSVELMMRHLTEPAPRVADVARARGRAEVPAPIDQLVTSLLSKDPEQRPASAEALVDIVAALRDASRATQPDNRLPTPMGGFSVPTPGSVSLPTATGATPIPLVSPSGALAGNAVAQKPITAPTTTVPIPQTGAVDQDLVRHGRPPLRKVAKGVAAMLTLFVALPGVAMCGYEMYADRAIPVMPWLERESWKRYHQMDDALLNLELSVVKQNARFLLQEKQHEVPMAWLYLAHVAILERQPLTVIDSFHAQARASAERREKAIGRSRHTHLMVDALTESDPERARAKWAQHVNEGGCSDQLVEEHMFAQRQTHLEVDGQKLLDTFRPLTTRYGEVYPLARIGEAQGLRVLGKLDEAEAIVKPLLAARPLNVVLLDAMVDIDLDRGDDAAALARIDARLAEDDDLHLVLRRAAIALRTDPQAVERLRPRLALLPDANPAKTLALGYLGFALAARGQFKEADAVWRDAKSAAVGPEAPMRIGEMAVFASMFAAIIGDSELAKRWLDEYQQVRDGVVEGPGARRMKAVALGNRIMLAADDMKGKDAGANAARDFAWLMAEPIDIPLLTQTIHWHVKTAQRDREGARQVAQALPRCWKEMHLGMTAAMGRDFDVAIAHLEAATTSAEILACTAGDDVVQFIQAAQIAKALGFLATASCLRNDREAAAATLERLHAYWPHASSPSANPEWQRYVGTVDAWLKAPGGSLPCVPPELADLSPSVGPTGLAPLTPPAPP